MGTYHLMGRQSGLANPRWETSKVKECWVGAGAPDEARNFAVRATMIAQGRPHGEIIRESPWYDPQLTDCIEAEGPHGPVPHGKVLDEHGHFA